MFVLGIQLEEESSNGSVKVVGRGLLKRAEGTELAGVELACRDWGCVSVQQLAGTYLPCP